MIDIISDLFNSNHRKPIFKVVVTSKDDKTQKDITHIVSERLISLTLTDNRGFEADQLDITLSDHDSELVLPSRGATINLAIGFKDTGLVDKGSYKVDEIEFSGPPDTLVLRARSADLFGSLTTKQERSFHQIKIKDLVAQLAAENKLKPLCDKELGEQTIEHLDQQNESTINLLTRLAKEYDAIATVKNGYLMFFYAGEMKTANGKPLPSILITKQSGDSYRFNIAEGDNYSAVRAYYYNTNTGEKGEVIIDKHSEIQRKNIITKTGKVSKNKQKVLVQHQPVESDANQMKTLRHTYDSEKRAINSAKAAFDKMKRGVASFSLTLAYGRPELIPEMPAVLAGFKGQIDSSKWIVTQVTHNLNDSGYTSNVEFELNPKAE